MFFLQDFPGCAEFQLNEKKAPNLNSKSGNGNFNGEYFLSHFATKFR